MPLTRKIDLLKPSTDIWNKINGKTLIWKEQVRLPQQAFAEFALENHRKKLLSDFIREGYFLYDKSNIIEEFFITEITTLTWGYGSISYFGKKLDEIVENVSSSNPLELNAKYVKIFLNFQLIKISCTNITSIDKKIHRFPIT